MNMRDAFREQIEMVVLKPSTISELALRTQHSEEELILMMKKAYRENRLVVFKLFRIEKLS